MKTKYFAFFIMSMFALSFVAAGSYRGNGGNINYIGGNNNLINPEVSLNFWQGSNAQAGFMLSGDSSIGRIKLYAKLKQSPYGVYYGTATYWHNGILPQRLNLYSVVINTNGQTSSINGISLEGINFYASNIPTVAVN